MVAGERWRGDVEREASIEGDHRMSAIEYRSVISVLLSFLCLRSVRHSVDTDVDKGNSAIEKRGWDQPKREHATREKADSKHRQKTRLASLFSSTSTCSSSSSKKTATTGAPQGALSVTATSYPSIRRDASVVETLHGEEIPDPYRWLEDPDSKETEAFVEKQNMLTASVLAQCKTRDKFKNLMTELYDYPRFSCPSKRGER